MTVPIERRREQKSRCENKRRRNFTEEQKEHIRVERRKRKDVENARNRQYYYDNIDAINKQRKAKYEQLRRESPEQLRFSKWKAEIKSQYGITPEQFDAMLVAQGYRCAICGDSDNGGRKWHIDHCHQSKQVRGLLCGHCNKMLGLAKDAPSTLIRAAQYLEQFSTMEAISSAPPMRRPKLV